MLYHFHSFQREKTRGKRKPSLPKELKGGCNQSPSGQEVRDMAAEASAPDSLAPYAKRGFKIREPDQLEGVLEVRSRCILGSSGD